jgi:hypothetical protein
MKSKEPPQYIEPQLYDYFYQDLVPLAKKKAKPEQIFDRYKQTNNLEDIAEEESLNESSTMFNSNVKENYISISSPENLKKNSFKMNPPEIKKEPWELENNPYPHDVFFEANESHKSRKLLNVSDSTNLISPIVSGRRIVNEVNANNNNVNTYNQNSNFLIKKKIDPKNKKSEKNVNLKFRKEIKGFESPILQKFSYDYGIPKNDQTKEPIIKIRKNKESENKKKEIKTNIVSPKGITLRKKRSFILDKKLANSKEKVIISRSKSPVTSAYKKILLENKSKNLDIREVVKKSLRKNKQRRLSLSPENKEKWDLTKKERKIIKKNSSEQRLNSIDVNKQTKRKLSMGIKTLRSKIHKKE